MSKKSKVLIVSGRSSVYPFDDGTLGVVPKRDINNDVQLLTSVLPVDYPIDLPVGVTVLGWKLFLEKTSTDLTARLKAQMLSVNDAFNTGAPIGTGKDVAANPGLCQLEETGLTALLVAGTEYHVRVIGCGFTGDRLFHLEVSYDDSAIPGQ
jgi:hypothetical protein